MNTAKPFLAIPLVICAYFSPAAATGPAAQSSGAAPIVMTGPNHDIPVSLSGPARLNRLLHTRGYLEGSEGAAFRMEEYPYTVVNFSVPNSSVIGCKVPEAPPPPPPAQAPKEPEYAVNQLGHPPKAPEQEAQAPLDPDKAPCVAIEVAHTACPPVKVKVRKVNPSGGNKGYVVIHCEDVLPQSPAGTRITVTSKRYQYPRPYYPFGSECITKEAPKGWNPGLVSVDSSHMRGTLFYPATGSCPHRCFVSATCGADGKWEKVHWF